MRRRTTSNADIRFAAKRAGLCLWQIGESMGMSPSAFSLMMRHELDQATKATVFEAIRQLSREP